MPTKTIFITGGIVSGLGKGITAASLGALLKARGFLVAMQKMDMYLNVDAGTMNPYRHGEVFVTEDGAETDLDLGHYERFLDSNTSKLSIFTMGKIYQSVINNEREGKYLGVDIQVVPHVTDEIQSRFDALTKAEKPDFQLIEMGGTVGHLEEGFALEAMRQYMYKHNLKKKNCISVHVVKMDYLFPSDEGKTKPIQHASSLMRSLGLEVDILIVRAKRPLTGGEKSKLALFCGLQEHQIITALNAESLYDIPLNFEKEGLATAVMALCGIKDKSADVKHIQEIAKRTKLASPAVKIALVGKYTDLTDTYLSVIEAAKHAGIANKAKVEIVPIDSEHLDMGDLKVADAVIVPGGFGQRGVEGKIKAIQWARENNIPYLGICLGLQTAVIEFARNVCGITHATSEEFDSKSKTQVIAYLPEQSGITQKGGTMRLGSYEAKMHDSLIARLYAWWETNSFDFPALKKIMQLSPVSVTHERHRHRFEVNPEYHDQLVAHGMRFAGMSPNGSLVEFIELDRKMHPYFVATQAHPEFKSRPNRAHPLFSGLVRAALEQQSTK